MRKYTKWKETKKRVSGRDLANQQSFHVFCVAQILFMCFALLKYLIGLGLSNPVTRQLFHISAPQYWSHPYSTDIHLFGCLEWSVKPTTSVFFLLVEIYLLSWIVFGHVDVISASIGEDVCCYYMPPCNLKRLHYQFPQCKLDRVVNAFSLQLLIISGAMGGWIRGQDKSSLSSTFHKITV